MMQRYAGIAVVRLSWSSLREVMLVTIRNPTMISAGAVANEGIAVNIGKNVTVIPDYLFKTDDVLKIKTVTFAAESVCESIGNIF